MNTIDVAAAKSPEDRRRLGTGLRSQVPRRTLGTFDESPVRPDPVEVLQQQATSRVPELVPIRYGRMLTSPFAFYRGAAAIMAIDLASSPSLDLRVQLCGDAHLSNFGVFASPERRVVFDINDFDETLAGPFDWDVKRLVTSFAIAGRHRGMSSGDRERLCTMVVRQYCDAMAEFALRTNLEVWYAHLNTDALISRLRSEDPKMGKRVAATVGKARTRDSMQALGKLTEVVDGRRRIMSAPPLLVPAEELGGTQPETIERLVADTLEGYSRSLLPERAHLLAQYRYVHLARKVVGVGSVGTRAYVVLLEGRDADDALFLQIKEAQPSVLAGLAGPSRHDHDGERVVTGQRMMQAVSDIFLGWHRIKGADGVARDYYVRQLRDWKGSADIDSMRPQGLALYARLCGWTLARAHARSGDRVAIAGYLGKGAAFEQAMVSFAELYADRNEKDFAALRAAVDAGQVDARHGL
jgi:uncharacterized protein (DUF2252 family)